MSPLRSLPLDEADPRPTPPPHGAGLALVMTGGGARAAYQAGVLRGLLRLAPEIRPSILTGVSAGGLNATFLAAHEGPFSEAVQRLVGLWGQLRSEHVFRTDSPDLARNVARWGRRLVSGSRAGRSARGLLDTAPLRAFIAEHLGGDGPIAGVAANIAAGRLDALALTTTSYTTGQSITWVEGRDVQAWDRPSRRVVHDRIRADHVMASAALPFFFPAVRLGHGEVGEGWYGDGGIRLTAPLSPALHLGARKILAVNTRHVRSAPGAAEAVVDGYPPPAQILGVLMNAIFLDLLDRDAQVLHRINDLVARTPDAEAAGFRHVDLLVLRPSQDLAKLAGSYEPTLPRSFRFLMRGLGTRETRSPDWLSMLLFEPEYLRRALELGEQDALERADEIRAFLAHDAAQAA